ncbi:carboxy terminal-processing peptidase [Akkermansia sp. N21116]|uniref:carboxy terminal-processing peptidase n=1 Tax=Akkermansia sp. N21116 TaxID=3040764 RepID=UPI00244EA0CD|nr:carboxy terminal-processing peptidase [Akkermansia sp. N21116]WPX40291.1 carboxy terminal-processing peptidase [Akkermansia sp. N21116]
MHIESPKWFRNMVCWAFASMMLVSCVQGATNFDDVGKMTAILLQNMHFSRKELNDKVSGDCLDMYLKRLDPSRIFFTQQDVDTLKSNYGTNLGYYMFTGKLMNAAVPMYTLYCRRVEQRVGYARELLEKENFQFDRKEYVPLSRRKVNWPKDEEEMNKVWHDMVEEQLLSEILRRETMARLAREQNKPDPAASEKSPKEKLSLRYERLLRNVKESSDEEDVASALLSAVALAYDPHTEYMDARETDEFRSSMDMSISGIGALLGAEDDGSVKISGIVVGGPADKSGELKLNDRILGVSPNDSHVMTDVLYMRADKVVELVRGKEGTRVRLKVEPASTPGHIKEVVLTRAKVETKAELCRGEIMEMKQDDGRIAKLGILTLPSFYVDMDGGSRSCAADVKKILKRMVKEGVEGLVLDLRDNGGGSLEEVRLMTGFFIGAGPVVQVKDSRGKVSVLEVWNKEPLFKGQMVVLTNKLSASASEILAAALQDYGRAVIVGDKSTFGKGTVQSPIELNRFLPYFSDSSRAGTLKLTVQKFYRVAGGSTQKKGVESDVVLPSALASYELGEESFDYVMPYDQIPGCEKYRKDRWIGTVLPTLRERSGKRVARDRDFRIMEEDALEMKKRQDENKLSLNKEERERENRQLLERRKAINEERRVRFAEMAKNDAERYKIYRLTLDDVNADKLPQADPEKDNEQFIKIVENPDDELDDSPEYPSGLDPELRESLNIVADMVNLKKGAPLASSNS